MRNVQTSVELNVQAEKLWRAITDHEALPRHIAFLSRVGRRAAGPGSRNFVFVEGLRRGYPWYYELSPWMWSDSLLERDHVKRY